MDKRTFWKTVLFVTLISALLLGSVGIAYAGVYSAQKTKCYTWYYGGVRQWKHCITAKFKWDDVTHLVKCQSALPGQSFTAYQPGYTFTTTDIGCWQAATWDGTGHARAVGKVKLNGITLGYDYLYCDVKGIFPGVFNFSHVFQ